jgi:asparagine synthase (glutamine-hydrolysing)
MCGIVGFFDRTGKSDISSEVANRATDLLAARGPDGRGTHHAPGIFLGHRRLAIIDVTGGTQPFTDSDSGAVITYNGELYNYREIRNALDQRGRVFRTESDTEVVLQAYLEWGADALQRFNGMFAFAIYQPDRRLLFMARDRIGIKPLFYSACGTKLHFASTCPALQAFPDVSRTLSPAAVSHYLTTIRTTLGDQTLFRDIRALPPGTWLESGSDGIKVRRYWDFPMRTGAEHERTDGDAERARTEELVRAAVSDRHISEVPLGGFLSGGLDSSVIAALSHAQTGGRFETYSVGYDRPGYSEWDYVRSMVAHTGLSCREIRLNEEAYPDTWQMLVSRKGLPISTPNEIAIYHLSRAARERLTVVLSGEGADEVFGGYVVPYFSAFDYDRAPRQPLPPNAVMEPGYAALRRLYGREHIYCRPDHYFLTNAWVPFADKARLISPAFKDLISNDDELFTWYEDAYAPFRDCTTFHANMQVHARVNLEGLLFRVDSSTMSASIEARVPFTDHRIVEHLFKLPDHLKMAWRSPEAQHRARDLNIADIDRLDLVESKILLRKAFSDLLPGDVLSRRKASFPVPFREGFHDWLSALPPGVLQDSQILRQLFSSSGIEQLLQNAGHKRSAMLLWPIVNLALWEQACSVTLP